MNSYSSVRKRLIVDPEDWNSVEMEAIGEVGSVLATAAVDLLDNNKSQWYGQDTCNS